MQFNRKELSGALAALKHITGASKRGIPRPLHIVTRDGRASLAASASGVSASVTAGIGGWANDAATVDADAFTRAVRACKHAQVSVRLDDQRVTVESGPVSMVIPALAVGDAALPANYPDVSHTTMARIDGRALADVARVVDDAICDSATRPQLCGVYLDKAGLAVATDGSRCHVAPVPLVDGALPGGIIPADAWRALVALAALVPATERGPGMWDLYAGDQAWAWHGPHAWITHAPEASRFPDWRSIMPRDDDNPITATVNARELTAALVPHVRLNRRGDQSTRISVNGRMTLETSTADGNASTTVPIEHQGQDVTAWFDSRYLSDLVKGMGGDNLVLRFPVNDLMPVEARCGDVRGVLMPRRGGVGK